jgi:hypothetical protein
MKKLLLSLLLLTSFAIFAQEKNDWEDWQKTSCYSKISFRMKSVPKRGEQFQWKIQFKSDYPQLISFNYSVTDNMEEYSTTTHRKTLNAKQLSDEIEIFTEQADIYILVDKVSLSPYPKDFQECDN